MKRKLTQLERLIKNGIIHGNGGEGGGGGGEDKDKVQLTKAEYDALVGERDSLKNKNTDILTKLNKNSEQLKLWEGLEPEKIRGMLKAFEQDEELKLISEGKFDEVIKKRTERMQADHTTALQGLTTERDEYKSKHEKSESMIRDLVINSKVLAEFIKEGGSETAVEDIVLRAKTTFSIEDGEPVIRDEKGDLVTGAKGAKTVKEWLVDLKEKAPHLFQESSGSGMKGNRSNGNANSIDAKMAAASKAGDVKEYRRLKALKAKEGAKE